MLKPVAAVTLAEALDLWKIQGQVVGLDPVQDLVTPTWHAATLLSDAMAADINSLSVGHDAAVVSTPGMAVTCKISFSYLSIGNPSIFIGEYLDSPQHAWRNNAVGVYVQPCSV